MVHLPRHARWLLVCALLLSGSAADAQLLARVEPEWSPFLTQRLLKGAEGADLIAEARGLLTSEPSRVAEVLGKQPLPPGPARRLAGGLRADALYRTGTPGLLEAQKLYRAVVTSDSPAEEVAWAEFMLGNIRKIQGYVKEAEVAYRASLRAPATPWRCAALFDLGVLEVEAGRYADARPELEAWLRDYGGQPGRALVLHLLAECLASLRETDAALTRVAEARRIDPDAWVVRPETGYALAEVFRRAGNTEEAVRVLEAIPRAYPGTLEGAKARLAVGSIRESEGNPASAARSYGLLLDEGATPAEGQEALLRMALLGAEYKDRVMLTDSRSAYRVFYRPGPTLEEASRVKDPARAQRALRALGVLARREGRARDALRLFGRVFQDYPESPESGRAYESFMDTLEAVLAERFRARAYTDVVEAYEAFKGPMNWVSTRDKGVVQAQVAAAYAALGAPKLAREVYEKVRSQGTRAVASPELEDRIVEARAREGDREALRAYAGRRPEDAKAQAALGRSLATEGRQAEARDHLLRAAELAVDPSARLGFLTEADRLADAQGRVGEHLAGLEKRRPVREALPKGPERDAWERSGGLAEARLKFANGDHAGAAKAFAGLGALSPEDTYLRALAEKRSGNEARARELFEVLAKGKDPALASLATFYLQVAGAQDSLRKGF